MGNEKTIITPRYDHDCEFCLFLGRWKEYDLYIHPGTEGDHHRTVIARWDSEGSEYGSGDIFGINCILAVEGHYRTEPSELCQALAEAIRRAAMCHYIDLEIKITDKKFETERARERGGNLRVEVWDDLAKRFGGEDKTRS